MAEVRFYPMPCRSLYCGEITCPATCQHLPKLQAFKAWQQRTTAHQPDPIWAPAAWHASSSTGES